MSKIHKKFYNINRWEQRFFMNLTPVQKLAWEYVNDRSDNIGVWQPNIRALEFHIGANLNVEAFFQAINNDEKRLLKLPDDNWFIPNYVKFQYCQSNPLNPNNRAHRSYLKDMDSRGLLEWFCIHQPEVMGTSLNYKKELNGKQLDNIPKPFKTFLDNLIKRSSRGLKEFSENRIEKDKEQAPEKDTEQEKDPAQEKANNRIQANNYLEASNGPKVELNEKPSLYYHNLANRLKKIIPENVFDSVSDEAVESDIQVFHNTLEGKKGIKDPRAFIIARARSTNWTGMRWDDFDSMLFETETTF